MKQSVTDDKPQKTKEAETTTNSTETIVFVGTTVEDMTSNMDGSTSDEIIKLAHENSRRSQESTISDSHSLLEENIEALEDEEEPNSHEVAVLAGNLVEDTVGNLDQGKTGVPKVEEQLMQIKGETASSTESITTDYVDADDSDTKEVITEDKPRERGNVSHTQLANDTSQAPNDSTGIPEKEEEICEISKTPTAETLTESGKIIDKDKKIHGLENHKRVAPKCSAPGAPNIADVDSNFQSRYTYSSATNEGELMKHEINKREAPSGQTTDSIRTTEEYNVNERTQRGQVGVVNEAIAEQNPSNNFKGDKESDGIHSLVSFVEINGKDFTGLNSSLSHHLPIVSEQSIQAEVIEEILASPMAAKSSLQLVEDFDKGYIKPYSSANNEEAITSTYEGKTIETQETMNSSQFDQPQQILLQEPEVLKFENSETLSTGTQLVESSSMAEIIFPNGSSKERENASVTVIGFIFQPNQMKITANTGKTSEEQCLLQASAPGRETGEETPLLQRAENMSSFSYSTEKRSKVIEDIPVASIAPMQITDEPEESEKSPLLSPRETLGDFSASNHLARNKKPLQSLRTEDRACVLSPLKEQESVPRNSTIVSSPRNKGKQKPRSSFFASCMCCATTTN